MKKVLNVLLFIFGVSLVTFSVQNVYAAETHTVTFVTGVENIVMDPFEVEDGDTINDKGINFYPQREGYAYPEWYTDANFINEFDFESKIYEDTTLYAKWYIAITEIHISSDMTGLTDGEVLPEFEYSLSTENVTIGNVSWYSDETVEVGGIVDKQLEYSVYMSAKAADGYTLDGALVYFNGEEVGEWIAWPLSMGGAEIGGTFFIPIEVNPSLEIIKGTDTYTIGESTKAEFEINADYSLFEQGGKVYIDGNTNPLEPIKDYTSREGSTIITLTDDFIKTLSEGDHVLKVTFNDDSVATTSFTVNKNTTTPTSSNNATITDNTPTQITNNPQTGDNIIFYVTLLGLSLISLIGVGLYTKKNLFNL